MKVGIDVSQHQLEWPELRERVAWADQAGFESAWVFDHFTALYGDRNGPCLEAWTLLAALAAVTTRIRLGALVTGVTYRHPSLLATEVVTVDHVSAGRLDVGLGAAWHDEEHRRLGFDFPATRERTERLDETVQIIKGLLTRDDFDFDGRHYRLQRAFYRPRPVQQPHPPIWIGAGGAKVMLPLAARHADVWHGFGSVSELARKSAVIDRAAEAAGRDPAGIGRSTNLSISESWDSVRRDADELRAAGFTHLIASWPSEGRARVEEFAADVMPDVTG
ncbi:MAG TPA: TIGR03560 family F420-dependent LLM class oxidoreductase [Acidimicrobiales bacterium]|nr:TIGR03560 family F420-dependent LLM class oxidoreductase [Acidimicrobiales bacterium]